MIEIAVRKGAAQQAIDEYRLQIDLAIRETRRDAAKSINVPWSSFDLAKFLLLGGDRTRYLHALVRAVAHSGPGVRKVSTTHESFRVLTERVFAADARFVLAREFLALASRLEVGSAAAAERSIEPPFLLVLDGGRAAAWIERESERLRAVLRDFGGTVLHVGSDDALRALLRDASRAAGSGFGFRSYDPDEHARALGDPTFPDRYRGMPALVRAWKDLVAADRRGRAPAVLVLGRSIRTPIEATACAVLGGVVACVDPAARVASLLRPRHPGRSHDEDEKHSAARRPMILPLSDVEIPRAFAGRELPSDWLSDSLEERLGRAIHEEYRRTRHEQGRTPDDSDAPWEQLHPDYRKSSSLQARDLARKLRRLGYELRLPVGAKRGERFEATAEQLEELAQMEHGRWVVERLEQGWTYGEKKDADGKTHPLLVPWSEVRDDAREYDRSAARQLGSLLDALDWEIVQTPAPGARSDDTSVE